ncbi:hypothetical protein CspeluHIS016_0601490 [Cutaneotrichosporon spelunceum]|uniref:Uncharacterized protein n=1 Tax=Cutaneotrichosporon spelunceum TaxID=1672016 RepID=A0AAD3TYF9_9TREE|nr:hypothetical protein CspeluHIS016_0601490 [Cutaneotrichosporon spelunceum]
MERIRSKKEKYIGGCDWVLGRFVAIIDDSVDTVAAKHGPGLTVAGIDVGPISQRLKTLWRCKWTSLKSPLRAALVVAIDRRIAEIETQFHAQPALEHYAALRRSVSEAHSLEELDWISDEMFNHIDQTLESERPEMLHRAEGEFKDALIVEMEHVLPPKYTCSLPNRRSSV